MHDERLLPVRSLIGENTRVGASEKDGVVFNRNLNIPGSAYPKLGWHTDGLRSLFYLPSTSPAPKGVNASPPQAAQRVSSRAQPGCTRASQPRQVAMGARPSTASWQ